ncbi:MAG TPA: hypothetical protein IAA60_00935 [Candidatus Ornithomonoglobus intestinigallinarum]|uniref:Phage gp6-like head-tail connector protein n=1 Tax=Candidatus Ornithomonoglobus intestinigallinarum TaxID=2840894 RepID=A0A9D1H2G1_9FIRM|nr:hypothetical protein [Candidatus Ornithomonoglobus intestinigallinarum]
MNYETNQVIRDTKMLLQKKEGEDDERIAFFAEDSVNAVLAYCRLEFLPYQLIGLTAQLAADRYRAENTNGGGSVASITEGDRKIDFSVPQDGTMRRYEERLKPFMNIKARVPSDKSKAEVRGCGI